MIWLTHILFTLLLTLIYFNYFNPALLNKIIFILLALFFSLFPDIDMPNSWISKKIRFLSRIIKLFFGHRGLFHSLLFVLAIAFIMFLIFQNINIFIIVFIIGYISHLLLDSITKQGIMPLYPLTRFRLRGFIKVGSYLEIILIIILIILIVLMILKI